MAGRFETKLAEMGITLPEAPAPAANYVPWLRAGGLLFVSGQISKGPEGLITGTLGGAGDVERGREAARCCAIALLAQVKAACDGDLDRLRQVVKLTGFVASAPGFFDQPGVVNGASDLLGEALGEAGRHTRSAVGVAALPMGVSVEIEGIFEIA